MEINWNRANCFEDLVPGDVFAIDSVLYMKLCNNSLNGDATGTRFLCNAVRLSDGSLFHIIYSRAIEKVQAELTVK